MAVGTPCTSKGADTTKTAGSTIHQYSSTWHLVPVAAAYARKRTAHGLGDAQAISSYARSVPDIA
eukprot:2867045-Rhodomonas_salina.8